MPSVSLLDYTGAGSLDPADYAACLLIFTKNTRLEMSPSGMHEIRNWTFEEKEAALSYMAGTIPSSHEFVHYTWMVSGVTRGFTHQFVRSRSFSFAQQTMRVLRMAGWQYGTGPTIENSPSAKAVYDDAMSDIANSYEELILNGAAIEDARGVLPTNILTNIVASCSLRAFVELVQKRSSPRVQGEYRAVLELMKQEVLKVHPWVELFVCRTFDRAAADLDKEIQELPVADATKTHMKKLVDQLRAKQ